MKCISIHGAFFLDIYQRSMYSLHVNADGTLVIT